jgi:ribonucleoside-diphosphate reductase alpha chain
MNSDEQGLCEVFAQLGKSGDCIKTFLEWGGRIISTAIRAGVSPKEIANMSLGLICPKPCWYEGKQILSCPDAIGRLIVEHLDLEVEREEIGQGEVCPECGKKMQSDSGCWRCLDCGYSKCN